MSLMRGSSSPKVFSSLLLIPSILTAAIISTALLRSPVQAQESAASSRPLITQPVDESKLTTLVGNTHPLARPVFDLGSAPATMPMERMLLVFRHSAEQESALRQLLDDQQDKTSPSYHKWLTPEQFGKQFGPTDSDLQTITAWLQSHGFQVGSTKGRAVLEFSGSASQVQEAFHTTIHKYVANGEQNWANASDPQIPTALLPAVQGVASLNNFPRHAHYHLLGSPARAKPRHGAPLPLFTFTSNGNNLYGLGPSDFATIYNVQPLWNAGIDGTGQTIAIVGESNINLTDIESFRSIFGLPANDPKIIVNGVDPGLAGDEPEAVLDVSWSGAVAKNATIDFVVSASTESTMGTDLSALYIVENNLAPVMSESYGQCEAVLGNAGNSFYNTLWQQAAAQGITVLLSSGDGGSAGCDNFDTEYAATNGLAVSGYASTPYNVAVGGTDFAQTPSTAPTYWNATNDATTGASAKSYIPEVPWNDSCAGLGADQCTTSSNFLNIVAGSGGPSSCSTQNSGGVCVSGYSKPSWQTGTSVPLDGVRDLPDVSLFASNGFNNSFYIICEADALFFPAPCSLSNLTFIGIGGTSASSPAFAGIMALVNQQMATLGLSPRQGNANYVLYKLAAQNGASCNSSTVAVTSNSCIFYDITSGTNSVPCYASTPNCGPAPAAGGYGILVDPNNTANPAWIAGPGYDMATGLGSVNASNLVNAWSSVTFTPSVTTLTSVSPASITHGQPVNVSVIVAPQPGSSGTPTGMVELMAAPNGQNVAVGTLALNSGVASGTTSLLPGGTYDVTAHYAGDATFGGSDSAGVSVTVGKENSQTKLTLEGYDLNAQTFASASSIAYGQIFFLRSDVAGAGGTACIPNPQQAHAACPTGSVTFTDNGKTLDAGTYPLNTQGYTEDQTVAPEFTTLGTYTLQANYGGDNSFNPSTITLNASVTQAPTYIVGVDVIADGTDDGDTATVDSGQAFQVYATAYTQSILLAPSGTITILQNGAQPSGTFKSYPRNGMYSGNYSSGQFYVAYLSGQWSTSIDSPGTYTFTGSYAGDVNYTGSQAPFVATVTVLDTTFNISTPIPSLTITPGQSGTATVTLVGTDNFFGPINVSCTLPSTMTEATCPAVTTNLQGSSVNATLTINTTAPHLVPANRKRAMGYSSFGIVAGVFLFAVPGLRRRRLPLALLCVGFIMLLMSCGGGNSGGGTGGTMDPGTPAGTYTVNVTATSADITRTASFTVTVQ
jgi:hypothetical protein